MEDVLSNTGDRMGAGLAKALQSDPAGVLEGFDRTCPPEQDESGGYARSQKEALRVSVRDAILDSGNAGSTVSADLYHRESLLNSAGESAEAVSPETAFDAGNALGACLNDAAGEGVCAVEILGAYMRFMRGESCGICLYCREGTLHLCQMLDAITGPGEEGAEISLMAELAGLMSANCLCPLGRAAANPVLTALDLFLTDFEHHMKNKGCMRQ